MKDILLEKFFEKERWEEAIEIGLDKHIDKTDLRNLLCPEFRLVMYQWIKNGEYKIAPPHEGQVPKDNGEFRTVYINENVDRIFLSIANNLLFEMCKDMIHPACKSYQKGIGCGKVVQEVSKQVQRLNQKTIGVKADLSKYFDTVPIEYIDRAFDEIEKRTGKSKIIDILREYYHSNTIFDLEGNLIEKYTSLKQGSAVASFLANVVLYDIDSELSQMNVYYVRYSDDLLILGKRWQNGLSILEEHLEKMNMKLNPKKVEILEKDKWFKFLGFSIRGSQISLSKGRLKDFQKEIYKRTIKQRDITPFKAIHSVNSFLYKGDGQYSWATSVLPIINVEHDIQRLNVFVMDCLRAVMTGKKKVGGLGYVDRPDGVVDRGTGKNVTANRQKTPKEINGYYTLMCMQKALLTCKPAYDTLVRSM